METQPLQKKGESLSDMGNVVGSYCDIMTMRHSEALAIHEFSNNTNVPVINAGNGSHQHPTQALVDVYTIYKEKNKLDKLNIGFFGDLKFSRTLHSLLELLNLFEINFLFFNQSSLEIDPKIIGSINREYHVLNADKIENHIKDLDVLYVTRYQKERDTKYNDNNAITPSITADLISKAKADLSILHPLPKLSEISVEIDKLPQAKYFFQAKNGIPVRMALIDSILNNSQI